MNVDEILQNSDLPDISAAITAEGGLIDFSIEWGLRLLAAIIILLIGWAIGRFVSGRINKFRRMDATLKSFLGALARYTIMAVSVITIIGLFGIPMASFLAVMGAAGLAIGLALQGTLSNVASGVMLLILRPFNVGDYIEFGSFGGTVKSLSLFGTELAAADNVYIYAPNSTIWGNEIKNYSRNLLRRQDVVVGISYDDDIGKALSIIEGILKNDSRILQDGSQAPQVMADKLNDWSVDIIARFWSKTSDYWQLRWDITKTIKEAMDANGIMIPYPTQLGITREKGQKE